MFRRATQSSGATVTGRSARASSCWARRACVSRREAARAGRPPRSSATRTSRALRTRAPADRIRSQPTAVARPEHERRAVHRRGRRHGLRARDRRAAHGSARSKGDAVSRLVVVVPLVDGARESCRGALEPGAAVRDRSDAALTRTKSFSPTARSSSTSKRREASRRSPFRPRIRHCTRRLEAWHAVMAGKPRKAVKAFAWRR